MRAGRLSCRALVEQYLRRIDTFDKNGPALNAIVVVNPDALKLADELDRRFAAGGPVGPLHCVPIIVKDNFETVGLQSANGSLALAGFVSPQRCLPGAARQGSRRHRARQVEHGGVGVHAVRNGQFHPAGLHEEPVRAGPRDGRLQRGHGSGGGCEFRRGRPRQRHRQLDPRPLVAPGARRDSLDDGADEPRRRDAARRRSPTSRARWRARSPTPWRCSR